MLVVTMIVVMATKPRTVPVPASVKRHNVLTYKVIFRTSKFLLCFPFRLRSVILWLDL
jgi:hypothetical protein